MSKPKVVCTILARGGGSTLYRKNLYPLLGKPVIQWALEALRATDFITDIVVWSEDRELLSIAEGCGAVPLERPRDMVHYYSGFHSSMDWYILRHQMTAAALGYTGDYEMSYNCNYILIRPDSLNAMFATLKGNESWSGNIQAVFPVRPGLCLSNTPGGGLFPFWNNAQQRWEEHPPLFRIAGVGIGNPKLCSNADFRPCSYQLSEEEGLDFQSEEDIPFAEYGLSLRHAKEGC